MSLNIEAIVVVVFRQGHVKCQKLTPMETRQP